MILLIGLREEKANPGTPEFSAVLPRELSTKQRVIHAN